MRGTSLRSRLFQAIGVVVLLCVALTIGLGLVLTRRAVERATLQDVEHQADLIAGRSGVAALAVSPTLPQVASTVASSTSTSSIDAADPARRGAGSSSRTASPREGTVSWTATRTTSPREPVGRQDVRAPAPEERRRARAGRRTSSGCSIAAVAGGAARRARRVPARAPDLAAVGPRRGRRAQPRTRHAPRARAGRGRRRDRDARGRVQRRSPSSSARAQEAERNFLLSVSHELKTPLTAIRGLRRGGRGRRDRPARGGGTVALEARAARAARRGPARPRAHEPHRLQRPQREIDLGEVAEDAVRRYQPQARQLRRDAAP